MPRSDLASWACRRAALPALGLVALIAPAPAQAAFPGAPGPIAYSYSNFTETGGRGGLRAGGTEEEGYGSHVGAPAWGPKSR